MLSTPILWASPKLFAFRRRVRSGSRRCRWSCRACSSGVPLRDSDDSTSRDTDTSHPFVPDAYRSADREDCSCYPCGGRWRGASRQSTPKRCPSYEKTKSVRRESVHGRRIIVAVRARVCLREASLPDIHSVFPSGSRSSPQGKALPSRPPRAAYSHSASVGSRLPAQPQ